MFKQRKLKNQRNQRNQRKHHNLHTRPIESFDYFENIYNQEFNKNENNYILYVKNQYYQFCLYWYLDESYKIYLSNVEVFKRFRKRGYGNILLKHAKLIAKQKGFKIIYLKVKAFSWIEKWYKRNDFKFFEYDDSYLEWNWLEYKIK